MSESNDYNIHICQETGSEAASGHFSNINGGYLLSVLSQFGPLSNSLKSLGSPIFPASNPSTLRTKSPLAA